MYSLAKQLCFVFFLGFVLNFQVLAMDTDSREEDTETGTSLKKRKIGTEETGPLESAIEKLKTLISSLSPEEKYALGLSEVSVQQIICSQISPIHAEIGRLCNKWELLAASDCYEDGIKKYDRVCIMLHNADATDSFQRGFLKEVLKELQTENGKKISRFSLACGKMDVECIKILIENFRELPNLKGIELASCNIDTKGACLIADFLKTNTTLLEIGLPENEIEDKASNALISAFEVNKSLQKADFTQNYISPRNLGLIENKIRKNIPETGLDPFFQKTEEENLGK